MSLPEVFQDLWVLSLSQSPYQAKTQWWKQDRSIKSSRNFFIYKGTDLAGQIKRKTRSSVLYQFTSQLHRIVWFDDSSNFKTAELRVELFIITLK